MHPNPDEQPRKSKPLLDQNDTEIIQNIELYVKELFEQISNEDLETLIKIDELQRDLRHCLDPQKNIFTFGTQGAMQSIQQAIDAECLKSDVARKYLEFKLQNNYIFEISRDRQLLKISRKSGINKSLVYMGEQNEHTTWDKIVLCSGKKPHLLGEGGYGKVKKGQHPKTRMNVAVKIQRLVAKRSSRKLEIEREVENLKIMGMYHNSSAMPLRNKHYICMQFIDGVDVFDAVMNNLDNPKEILRILLLAAKELQRIHNSNLIHRDIKFENFMYDTINDKCQLIDVAFLTSLKNKDKYTDNVQMGTDTYLAPELNQKSQAYDYSKETDRYAFGMMLYIAANYIKNSTKDNINIKSTINRFGLTYLRDLNGVPAPTDLSEFISAATDLLAAIENVSQSTPGLFFSDPVSKKLKPTPEICSPVKEKLIEGKPLITSSPSKRLFF